MRYLHVAVPTGRREAVTEIVEERGFDYTVTDEISDAHYESMISFPAPIDAIDPLLSAFREIGLERDSHVVVQEAEAVLSEDFRDLQDRYDELVPEEQIAHEEVREKAKDLVPGRTTYVLLSVVSAVVATAGLLLDAASIVVGSMVIAPLVGPALSTGVGTVLYDDEMFERGTAYQIFGFGLAIVSATVFAALVRVFFLVPPNIEITTIEQISGRMSPDLLALAVALGAGAAGARSLETDISTPLVGVMMAAALIPPAAAAGIGIAWWLPNVVFRSMLLVLVNVLSINLCAILVLWYSGYRSEDRSLRKKARSAMRVRVSALLVGVLVLTSVLGVFTLTAYQTGQSSQTIENDVNAVLEEEPYRNLSVVEVGVERRDQPLAREPNRVVVTVTSPEGRFYPQLDDRIHERIRDRTGRSIDVQVRFIGVATTGDSSPGPRVSASPRPGDRRYPADRRVFWGDGAGRQMQAGATFPGRSPTG